MTSEAPGCPGCEYGLTWEIRGNRLILGLAPGESLPRVDGFHMLGTLASFRLMSTGCERRGCIPA